MLDIYEMEVFLAAAETGSFSEAGRRMQLSQPAISMQIRSLERRLGVDLFHRAGRHINLSEIGQALVPLARDLVNHAAQVEERVAALHGEVIGTLRIACSATAGKYLLPRLIARFMDQYPAVQVNCQMVGREAALQLVQDGEAQIGISSLHERSRDLEFRPFVLDEMVLIVPPGHEWALCVDLALDDLPTGRFIFHEPESGTQHAITASLSGHSVGIHDLSAAMVLDSSEAICMAVAEGIGAAFVSRRVAAESIASGRVVEVPVRGLEMQQQLYLVRHTRFIPSSVQSAFWEFVYSPRSRDLLGC
ncbi:MAG: LysR family transcriptional regulator [Chloroflexi bacterium]|nr:LysR family transcriptional regulator [Chloroflexota bacterium]